MKGKFCPGCAPSRSTLRPALYAVLRARDGDNCCLCGEYIDPTVSRREPLGETLDHKVPASLGGSDDVENLHLAHFVCNIVRGATPLDVYLARVGA
jgi:5-methylcytosine-specific restriction endonuclease McrA